jgi:hypothetical protein
MRKHKFTAKFYLGFAFVILSLIVGKVTQITFFLYFNEQTIRDLSVIIYLLSWPPFIVGMWWIGKEYADKIRKYSSFFAHEAVKKRARKVAHHTRRVGGHVKKKIVRRRKKNV